MRFLIIGLGLMYLAHLVRYTYYSRLSQVALFLAVPLLGLTLAFGTNLNQASRWLSLPGINTTFQTSDLAKLALIMYVARMCRGVLPHMQKTGGSILNVTAISAIQPIPRFGLSVASWGAACNSLHV